MDNSDEGRDIPQINGLVTPEDLQSLSNSQLIEGKTYVCEICCKPFAVPFIYRCICGLRICKHCENDHVNW